MKQLLFIITLGAAALPPLAVEAATPAIEKLFLEASSPEDLRTRLLERATSAVGASGEAAGESYYYRGVSFARAGQRDSAIANYRRAVEVRGGHAERLASIDALLSRRGPGDVAEALRLIQSSRSLSSVGYRENHEYTSLLAWGLTLSGQPDSAVRVFAPLLASLTRQPEWRYRVARAHLEAGNPRTAFPLLFTLAVSTRGRDQAVQALLERTAAGTGGEGRLDGVLQGAVAARDRVEREVIERMHGRRVLFAARDGFNLSGIVLAPEAARQRAAVVLVSPGDTLADYDSLGIALSKAGVATMLLQVRGSGWSVASTCPSPDTWTGREEQLERLTARDVLQALRGLAARSSADTSAYLVVGVGRTAGIAVQAAELDRRVKALMLVSPKPAAVERGPMRARLARLQLPVYFLSGPEDMSDAEVTDALYQAGNRGASRVAEARLMGHGPLVFYHDRALVERFIRWLNETMPPAASKTTPPTARRRG